MCFELFEPREQALLAAECEKGICYSPSDVLQYSHMSHTLTIRLTDELLDWLRETSRRTGIPVGRLIREQLETARAKAGKQRFLRHAGAIAGGPSNVSSRKGFSRS